MFEIAHLIFNMPYLNMLIWCKCCKNSGLYHVKIIPSIQIYTLKQQAEKLKSRKMKDEGLKMNDESWKVEGWKMKEECWKMKD